MALYRNFGKLLRRGGKALAFGKAATTAYKSARANKSVKRKIRKVTYKKRKNFGKFSADFRWKRMTKSVQQAISQHNNLSTRSFKYTIRNGPPLRKKVAYKYMSTWDTIISGSEGIQALGVLKSIGSRLQLLGTTSTARQDPLRDADNYYDLNPYKFLTGSGIFPTQAASAGAAVASDKIMYKYVSGTLSVLGMESISQKVEVLWCLCKKDSNDSPFDTWDNTLFSMRMGTTPAVPSAFTTGNTATPGAGTPTNPGAHPSQLPGFREMWKIIRSEKLLVQPGDQIDINFFFKINRLIDKINMDRSVTNYMGGYTIVPLIIQLGGLIGITETAQPSPAVEVTHGATKVGYHLRLVHTFQALPATARLPVTRFFPGAVVGAHTNAARYVEDTDEVDVGIKIA